MPSKAPFRRASEGLNMMMTPEQIKIVRDLALELQLPLRETVLLAASVLRNVLDNRREPTEEW